MHMQASLSDYQNRGFAEISHLYMCYMHYSCTHILCEKSIQCMCLDGLTDFAGIKVHKCWTDSQSRHLTKF